MIIRLCFKTPDVVFYATEDYDEDETAEIENACDKWVEYGECLSVDINTDTGECIPVRV